MDKNTIVGLVLMAAVLIGFSWYNTNQEKNLQGEQTEQTTQKADNNKQQTAAQKTLLYKLKLTALTSFMLPQREKLKPLYLKTTR